MNDVVIQNSTGWRARMLDVASTESCIAIDRAIIANADVNSADLVSCGRRYLHMCLRVIMFSGCSNHNHHHDDRIKQSPCSRRDEVDRFVLDMSRPPTG